MYSFNQAGLLLSIQLILFSNVLCMEDQQLITISKMIQHGKIEKLSNALQTIEDLNTQINSKGEYLIHKAVRYKDKAIALKMVHILVENGSNINVTDFNGHTPLGFAVEKENYELITFLIKKGARTQENNLNSNPFFQAMRYTPTGNDQPFNLVKFLIDQGVHVAKFDVQIAQRAEIGYREDLNNLKKEKKAADQCAKKLKNLDLTELNPELVEQILRLEYLLIEIKSCRKLLRKTEAKSTKKKQTVISDI